MTLKKLLNKTKQYAESYLETMNDEAIQVSDEDRANLQGLDFDLQYEQIDEMEVIQRLNSLVSPATMKMTSSRFFGFVIGGSYPVSIASNWLGTVWDQNTGLEKTTPATAAVEQVSARWMLELLGLPEQSATAFVTGATVANFTALAAARNQIFSKAGWDVEANGLIGAPELHILISEESHPTVYKSLAMLGLGRNRVTKIPCDDQGRMILDKFPKIQDNSIIITQAGNINSGSCDPIGAICDLVKHKNSWVHVDGAFGLWVKASKQHKYLLNGVEKADSWATDAHKWLNVPFDSGLAFVKNQHALKAAMAITAAYLPTENAGRNPSDYTPELSRRARGLDIYAVLHHLGRSGVEELVDRCCACARQFASAFTDAGYDVMNEIVMNQVVINFGSDEINLAILDAVQKEGSCWVGQTIWKGVTAMRISVSNWQTNAKDVEKSLAVILAIASKHVN